jgi:mono/diheme cytochrome c family protein
MKKLLNLIVLLVFATPAVSLASGQSDYKAKCASCHGANANVQTEKAKALNMDVQKLALKVSKKSREEMIGIIEKGKEPMPGFKKELNRKQITAIVDYVIALREKK